MKAQLFWADISAILADDPAERLARLIPADGWPRIRRYRQIADQNRAIMAESLCREAVAAILGCAPIEVPLRRTAAGRPWVDAPGAPFVSLSHSGGYVAAAVGETPVGVDVETRPIPPRVLRRFFPAAEQDAPDPLALWTLKEAYAKAAGLPLAEALAAQIPGDAWQWETQALPGGARVTVVWGR